MRDVQIGRRLIEEQKAGLLCQRRGDPRALPLAAGKAAHFAVRHVRHRGGLHRPPDDLDILLRFALIPFLVGHAPVGDEVLHGDVVRRDLVLGKNRDLLRQLFRRHLADLLALEQNRAAAALQNPRHRLQQRGFSAPVRADQRRHPAGLQAQVHPPHDDVLVVPDLERFYYDFLAVLAAPPSVPFTFFSLSAAGRGRPGRPIAP